MKMSREAAICGGLRENVARVLPKDCDAVLNRSAWTPQPIFDFLRRLGVTRTEMYKVFNMGIGYTIIVRPKDVDATLKALKAVRQPGTVIGYVGATKKKPSVGLVG